MDYSEFKCKWIDPASLWNIADETRNKYWPGSKLPVNTEKMVEFRLIWALGSALGSGVKPSKFNYGVTEITRLGD